MGTRSLTDRTTASDAVNVGSIPAECIMELQEENQEKKPQKQRAREGTEVIMEKLKNFPGWLSSHVIVALVSVLVVACLIIIIVFVTLGANGEQKDTTGVTGEAILPGEIPEVPMERDTYPAVDALVTSYFEAIGRGDAETVRTLARDLDDTEAKRIEVSGEYIEEVPKLEIYVKKGLLSDTYVAYVLNYIRFKGFEDLVPGLRTLYICKDPEGSYYIQMGNVSETEDAYITGITLQQDVKDLNNRVAVEYNDLIANNAELNDFLEDMKVITKERVGEMIVQEEEEQRRLEEERAAQEAAAGEGEDTPSEGESMTFPRAAKVSTKVNVRTSDSIEADRKGQLAQDQEVTVLENRPNGWSKISFEDGEAFVKTEFLVFPQVEAASAADVTGTVKAKENVNIRAAADQNSERLGVAHGGDELQLIERLPDGWCRILYNNAVAYVKAEFVE